MSTTRGVNKSRYRVFKGYRKRTRQYKNYIALPVNKPYRRLIRFHGLFINIIFFNKYYIIKKTVKKKRELFLGFSQTIPDFVYVTIHYPLPGLGILT
jgi:hypothetical protein